MHENLSPRSVKLTINIPADLLGQLEAERDRLAADLRTRLSVSQAAVRLLRLGLDG